MKKLTVFLTVFALTAIPGSAMAVTLTNPLGTTDPRVLIGRLIEGGLSVMGSIALIMFMYGGLLWLTSGGKPDAIKKGKDILIWSVLGIILIVSAYVIVNAVFQAVLTGNVAG